MNQYKVSVILIYQNNGNTVRNCVESILGQPFPNIEVICVNNGSNDNSEEIIKEFSQKDNRVKLIKLAKVTGIKAAQAAGLGVASGKFTAFINADEKFDIDLVKEIYYTPSTSIDIKTNRLYRRVFLENDEEIIDIINKALEDKVKNSGYKEEFDKKLDEFQKYTADNIKNSTYELTCRFNQLEKTFYEKDYQYQQAIENSSKPYFENLDKNTKQIYEDIQNVYNYINSEINKKGCEVNKLYDEINKNYHYTEDLISSRVNDAVTVLNGSKDDIYNKIENLEKEITLRYVNLKRLMDMQLDEVDSRLKGISAGGDINSASQAETEKYITSNLDNVYSVLNKTSSEFYEELSKIYKEINEKLIKQKEDEQFLFDKKLSEMKIELQNEFDKKLESIKKEING